jgi:hypothetical protein
MQEYPNQERVSFKLPEIVTIEGEYGKHFLVGNYFDCVGNCADYLVVPKTVRRASILKDVFPSYVGK